MTERRLDDTGPVPEPAPVTTLGGGSHPSQLTEREAVLYAAGRRETMGAVLDELRAAAADPDRPYADAAAWAAYWLAPIVARYDRLVPFAEPPDAPCGIAGAHEGRVLLCGTSAGHGGPHAWQGLPASPRPRSGWRRLLP